MKVGHGSGWIAEAMETQTFDQRPDLHYGRFLLPRSLQATCELLPGTEGVSSQPQYVFDSLERSMAGDQPADDLVLDRLQSTLPRACLALQQASSTGWPSVRLLRSLVSSLADLGRHKTVTNDSIMEADPPESQTVLAPAAATMSNLLTCLWLFCQLSMTLDQVTSLQWPVKRQQTGIIECLASELIAAIDVALQLKRT